jgi:hypothetical protein
MKHVLSLILLYQMTYNISRLALPAYRNTSLTSSTSTGDTWTLFFNCGKLVHVDSVQHGSFDSPRQGDDCVFLYQLESDPGFKKRLCLTTNLRSGPITFYIRRNLLAHNFDGVWTIVEEGSGSLNCAALVTEMTESDEKLSSLSHRMHDMACELKNGHIPSEDELNNLIEEITALRK